MRLRVLGCSGAEQPGWHTSSYLIDETLLIDAGSACQVLSLAEQSAIRHVCVTHAHLDHVGGIAPLAGNMTRLSDRHSVEIVSITAVVDALRTHLFNDVLWPDFSRIPSPERPAIAYREITPWRSERLGAYTVTACPVDHTVPAVGYLVQKGGCSLLFSGDTGPTTHLWRLAGGVDALVVDVSFPDVQEELALRSGHLTARLLGRELEKVSPLPGRILVAHAKPPFFETIRDELGALPFPNISLLRDGDLCEC